MKSQLITSKNKKKALDKFDSDYFSESRKNDAELLNQVGKINVGWNINYIRSLPKPDVIIDVGAADDFQVLHEAHDNCYSILIDPNKNYELVYENFLKHRNGEYHICALGENNYSGNYYLYPEKPYLSTLIKRKDVENLQFKKNKINIKTLDDIIDISLTSKTTILKIDVEGSEVNILNGASNILKDCDIIICECSLSNNFPGGHNFNEIFKIMTENKFNIKDILRVPRQHYNSFPAEVLDIVFTKN